MTTLENNTYFVVRDKHGDEYLCPLISVGNRDAITDDELSGCVGKDIVERYSGNFDIEQS